MRNKFFEKIMKNKAIRRIIHVFTGISIILLVVYNILNTRLLFYFLLLSIVLSILSIKIKIPIGHNLVLMYKKERDVLASLLNDVKLKFKQFSASI